MSIRIQRFDEHLKMPWKNGLGITREVISKPALHGPGGFDWRISLATVGASGPFSVFPGIDRTIAVLQGDGMRLTVDGHKEAPLTVESMPFPFSGDAEVDADCLGGETLDLNVMSLRGRFVHRMTKVIVSDAQTFPVSGDMVAVVFRDDALVTIDRMRLNVGLGDVLLGLEGRSGFEIEPQASGSTLYTIAIRASSGPTSHGEQVA